MAKPEAKKVRCVCCQSRIPEDKAVPQADDTFLCVPCEKEAWEYEQQKYEAEDWAEINRVVYGRTA